MSSSFQPRSFLFALDPEMLTAEEYVQFLGPAPWSPAQCRRLREKMVAEGYDMEAITGLVGDGSNLPHGIFNATQ